NIANGYFINSHNKRAACLLWWKCNNPLSVLVRLGMIHLFFKSYSHFLPFICPPPNIEFYIPLQHHPVADQLWQPDFSITGCYKQTTNQQSQYMAKRFR